MKLGHNNLIKTKRGERLVERLIRKIGIDVFDIQTTNTPYTYLALIIGFVYILKDHIIVKIGLQQYGHIIIPLILCCIGLTIGYKDIDKYVNWQGDFSKNIGITIKCWLLAGMATLIIYKMQSNIDVQQLDKLIIPLSKMWSNVLAVVLTGIGEEFFKFLCFITIFTLSIRLKISKVYAMLTGVILSSLFFGGLHIGYNTEMWVAITIGIGVGACVEFYFLFKYKSIIPLILAHALQDVMCVISHTEYIGDTFLLVMQLFCIIVVLLSTLKDIFLRTTI